MVTVGPAAQARAVLQRTVAARGLLAAPQPPLALAWAVLAAQHQQPALHLLPAGPGETGARSAGAMQIAVQTMLVLAPGW